MEQYRVLTIVVAICIGFPVYFIPAYIAAKADLPEKKQMLFWNVIAGWTVLGWVFLLFTAVKKRAEKEDGTE